MGNSLVTSRDPQVSLKSTGEGCIYQECAMKFKRENSWRCWVGTLEISAEAAAAMQSSITQNMHNHKQRSA